MIVGTAAGGNAGNADNVKNLNIIFPSKELEKKIEEDFYSKRFPLIDRNVYKLYGLTEEEIAYIESN